MNKSESTQRKEPKEPLSSAQTNCSKIYSLGAEVDTIRQKLTAFARIPVARENGSSVTSRDESETLLLGQGRDLRSFAALPSVQEGAFLSLMSPKQLEKFDRLTRTHQFLAEDILSRKVVPLEDSYFDRLASYNRAVKIQLLEQQPSPLASDEEYITSSSSSSVGLGSSSAEEMGDKGRKNHRRLLVDRALTAGGAGAVDVEVGGRQLPPLQPAPEVDDDPSLDWDAGEQHGDSQAADIASRKQQGLLIDPSRGGEGWHRSRILRPGGPLALLVDFSAALLQDDRKELEEQHECTGVEEGMTVAAALSDSDHFGVIASSVNAVLPPSANNRTGGSGQGRGGDPGGGSSSTYSHWVPPHTALMSDPPAGWTANQSMPLFTRQVHIAPFNVEGLLDQQDWKCYGCWCARGAQGTSFEEAQDGIGYWDYEAIMSRAIGGVISLSDNVKFCGYTGHLFCGKCLPESLKKPIPSRLLKLWDVKPYAVCKDAAQFLEFHQDEPCLCVSAVNPVLLHQCPLLHQGRRLRQQLQTLHLIGLQCPDFRRTFYQESKTGSNSNATQKSLPSSYVPEHRRYLIEDTEFWSINDLLCLQKAQPVKLDTGVGLEWDEEQMLEREQELEEFGENNPLLLNPITNCEIIHFMVKTRDAMVRHVGRMCTTICLPRSCKTCAHCRRETAIFEFDVLNVTKCPKCCNLFHKACWETLKRGCPVCHQQMLDRRKHTAAVADL